MFSFRKVVNVVITLMSLLFAPVLCCADDNTDAALHAGISSVFGALGETYLHYNFNLEAPARVILGAFAGCLPGLAKELTDESFSGPDMAADVAGALLGALAANFVNNRIGVNVTRNEQRTTLWLTYSF